MNAIDDHLLEQLSALRAPELPADLAAGLEARFLGRLRQPRPGPAVARFIGKILDRRWEPVLVSVLAVLLGWDLLRIIGHLLE